MNNKLSKERIDLVEISLHTTYEECLLYLKCSCLQLSDFVTIFLFLKYCFSFIFSHISVRYLSVTSRLLLVMTFHSLLGYNALCLFSN